MPATVDVEDRREAVDGGIGGGTGVLVGEGCLLPGYATTWDLVGDGCRCVVFILPKSSPMTVGLESRLLSKFGA